jgi:hypothetical protein
MVVFFRKENENNEGTFFTFKYMNFCKSVFSSNKRLKLKNLTYIQQSNNKILTAKRSVMCDLCRVINWLFIILVLVSKKIAGILRMPAFFIGLRQ